MKKKFICVSFLFCLCACSGNKPATTPSGNKTPTPSLSVSVTPTPSEPVTPTPTPTPTITNSSLVISEFNIGRYVQNRALELYNISDETIDLSDYAVNIYRNFSVTPIDVISLEGTLAAKTTYVICFDRAKEDIKNKSDLVTNLLTSDGTIPISLSYKGKDVDVMGTIGYIYDYARQAHLVRKAEYLENELVYDENHWIRYPMDTIDTLGNVDSLDETTILQGPKLTNEILNKPFIGEDNLGGGGLISVTLNYNIDGDTSRFNYGYSLSDYDISGSLSTRYYGINTPEIAHSADETADPYGDEAKSFTTSRVSKAKHIYVQSVQGYSVRETYSRMLGYVWVTEKDNPSLSDYYLLNFEIVKNGLARLAFIDFTDEYENNMNYEGLYYIEYLKQANMYAMKEKLNIYS